MKWRGVRRSKLANGDRIDSDRTEDTEKTKKKERKLVKYEALPEYMKDNEFIRDYYRCEWPCKDMFLSLFSFHNETLNIWTHLVGFFIFVGLGVMSSIEKTKVEALIGGFFRPAVHRPLRLTITTTTNGSHSFFPDSCLGHIRNPSFINGLDADSIPQWPWFVFLGGAMSCLLCSSLSHLFACHSRSFNLFFWRLDYAGISLMIVCSFFAPIYYVFYCQPYSRLLYLTSISLLGILAIVTLLAPALSSPRFRSFRAFLFLAMGFSGVIPAAHAVAINWGHPQIIVALGYEIAMGILYAVGAGFYLSRIPERWKPGAFDIAGHSHQIFHVFVVAGALAHSAATLVVMDWRTGSPTCQW